MYFSDERQLLQLRGIGSTVRLEQIGFSSLAELKGQNVADITRQISEMLGSTCWHNSNKLSNQAVIDLANKVSQV